MIKRSQLGMLSPPPSPPVLSNILRMKEPIRTDSKQLVFFWLNAVRYGRVEVMDWAHRQQGYSLIRDEFYGTYRSVHESCRVPYGQQQLAALQWRNSETPELRVKLRNSLLCTGGRRVDRSDREEKGKKIEQTRLCHGWFLRYCTV